MSLRLSNTFGPPPQTPQEPLSRLDALIAKAPRGDGPLVRHPKVVIKPDLQPTAHDESTPRVSGIVKGSVGSRYDFSNAMINVTNTQIPTFVGSFAGAVFRDVQVIQRGNTGHRKLGALFDGDFRGAIFTDARLPDSRFNADLRGSNFIKSSCDGVNFGSSKLANVSFDAADLSGANLSRVPDLRLARFGGSHPTLIDKNTKFPAAWTQDRGAGQGSMVDHLLATGRLTYDSENFPRQEQRY